MAQKKKNKQKTSVFCRNKKAFHDYLIEKRFEAGISLLGSEVKSIRDGKMNLSGAWIDLDENLDAVLKDAHISPYRLSSYFNHLEKRDRRLLLRKSQLSELSKKTESQGYTIVPLSVYPKGPWIKVEIALARGKRQFDKREAAKEKEAKKTIRNILRTGS